MNQKGRSRSVCLDTEWDAGLKQTNKQTTNLIYPLHSSLPGPLYVDDLHHWLSGFVVGFILE